jgi:hypothetical protein
MTFRIFTNDRDEEAGVPMYSCLMEMKGSSLEGVQSKARLLYRHFGPPKFAPIVAVEWPATTQASKDWLKKHVG